MSLTSKTQEGYQEAYKRLKDHSADISILALHRKLELHQAIGFSQAHQTSLEQKISQGIQFLEKGCSTVYLHETRIDHKNRSLKDSVAVIPVLFDTAIIITLLHEHLSPLLMDNFARVVQENRNKTTGFYNYTLWHGDTMVCDDIDTTSCTIMALLKCKRFNFAEAQTLSIKMLGYCQKDKNGIFGTYFPKNAETKTTLFHQAAQGKSHTDVGVTLNTLWLLGLLQLDSRPEVQPNLNLLDLELNRMLQSKPTEDARENYKYYTSSDVVIFLFSQFLTTTGSANKARFEERLKRLAGNRILSIKPEHSNCLTMSLLVLAAFNLGLESDTSIGNQVKTLVRSIVAMQDGTDGKFPLYYLHEWVNVGFFGSHYFNTAYAVKAMITFKERFGKDLDDN